GTAVTRVGGSGIACVVTASALGGVTVIVAIGVGIVGAFTACVFVAAGTVTGGLGAGGVALAARPAAVAAACFLIVPVRSSMLLSSRAMRPASRSRSTIS